MCGCADKTVSEERINEGRLTPLDIGKGIQAGCICSAKLLSLIWGNAFSVTSFMYV